MQLSAEASASSGRAARASEHEPKDDGGGDLASCAILRQSRSGLLGTSPVSFTYSGSSGVRMLKRHLQHTWPASLRGGMARMSTFMFGLYSLVVTIIDFGHVEWQFFSRMSGRPIDSHWSAATQRLNVMMPTSGSGISKERSNALPGIAVAST